LRIHLPLGKSDKDSIADDCFPTNKGKNNKRALKSEDGGQLRLAEERFVDIPPTADKVVMFLSEHMEHEVLPSEAKRVALTMWLY